MSTVADIQSGLAAIQSRIATIQSIIASGAAPTAAADFATALDSATAATSATSGTGSATASTPATATGGSLVASGVTGQQVAQDALKYVGVPYVFGGESTSGMDCSGLVQKVFKDLGVSVPRLVHEQQTIGQKVDSLKDAKPGDLIVLNGGDHIAIYLGNDTVIHAPYAGRTVSVQKAWFTDKDITAIRRVVPSDAASTGSTMSAQSLATAAQISALDAEAGIGDSSSGSSSLSSLLGGLVSSSSTSGSTAQQLLAAREALLSQAAS